MRSKRHHRAPLRSVVIIKVVPEAAALPPSTNVALTPSQQRRYPLLTLQVSACSHTTQPVGDPSWTPNVMLSIQPLRPPSWSVLTPPEWAPKVLPQPPQQSP